MKKLDKKIFWILFSILTAFVFIVLSVFNYSNYSSAEKKVLDNFRFMRGEPDKNISDDERPKDFRNIRFADMNVYTVLIDNGNISVIISHNFVSDDSGEIKAISKQIINSKENGEYIGNLYFDRYSYLKTNEYLILVDNSSVNHTLFNTLILSILIFVVSEVILGFVCYKITKWITEPVQVAFDKQKEFIADASHELKTPLSVIIASSEMLEKDVDNKYVQNIKNESSRMNRLILSLLDLAKSENTNKSYSKVNLSKIVQKSILTFESIFFEKGIILEENISDNIQFTCDSDEMKQLMSILIDNAVSHTKKGDDICISLALVKNTIEINVRNKGKSISKEDEEKIFERFYKADKSRNRGSNRYGLGLAIAKNIVTKHGGKISAHSSDGYTNFKVIFKNR